MRRARTAQAAAPATGTVYTAYLERLPESAGVARRLAAAALAAWQLPQLSDDTALVLTELVSNAVTHAAGEGMRVSVERLGERRIRLAVTDRTRTRPQLRAASSSGECGRGLRLIIALSARWGVDVLPDGKRVWADLEEAS